MVFSSSIFLFIFLPLTVAIYYLLNDRFKNYWLLLASLIFYSWGEPKYIAIILLSMITNYWFGRVIQISKNNDRQKFAKSVMILSIVLNLGILSYYKYFDFIVQNINGLTRLNIPLRNISLPIGISFYTFQIISYIIDVYRGEKAQTNIFDLGLYIALFPQLIAGPIIRYAEICGQLRARTHSISKVYEGCMLFMAGFSKKILIADQLAQLVDNIFRCNGLSIFAAWVGALSYMLQIYFDFSGYSDMSIGLGKMFGFDFNENFNYPYVSSSIKEFWRRWHISLSSWFKDYLYIPLGGSRCSKPRAYLNLTIVFFLTGLWHGASWNFIIWGVYYAVFLIFERLFLENLLYGKKLVGHIYSILVVMFGWVLFRAEDIKSALMYVKNMFSASSSAWSDLVSNLNKQYLFCLVIGVILSMPTGSKIIKCCMDDKRQCNVVMHHMSIIFMFIIFIIAISYMVGSGFSPFLYFRF